MEENNDGITIMSILGESNHPERSWQLHWTPVGHKGYALLLVPELFDRAYWIKDRGGITIAQDFISRFAREMENGDEIFQRMFNWSNNHPEFPFIVCDLEETDIRMMSYAMDTRLDELSGDQFESSVESMVGLLYAFQAKEFDIFKE